MYAYLYAASLMMSFYSCQQPNPIDPDLQRNRPNPPTVQTSEPSSTTLSEETKSVFPYNISQPDALLTLDDELWEISGLDYSPELGLVAVQDEQGFLYFLDENTGAIKKQFAFAKKGDYEAVRVLDKLIWVLQADGMLHKISKYEQGNPATESYRLPFDEFNDLEGLAVDKKNNQLLIACKNSPIYGAKIKDYRAVYSYDPKTQQCSKEPIIRLTMEQVRAYIQKHPEHYQNPQVLNRLDKGKALPFMPSEIAIHPISGQTYILAATGFAIFVLDAQGELLYIQELPENEFVQAEGLAFAPNGDMFISSEAKFTGNKPKIWRFNHQK